VRESRFLRAESITQENVNGPENKSLICGEKGGSNSSIGTKRVGGPRNRREWLKKGDV